MIGMIEEIFENSGFAFNSEIQRVVFGEETYGKVYINYMDEMYFVIETCLDGTILEKIIGICAKVEENELVKRRYKSNWVIIFVTKIAGKLTWEQRKEILLIEENKYFCRKYVFWYNEDEKKKMKELCNEDYSVQNINNIIQSSTYFNSFKEDNNAGYECLSRLFIKLPFMNLSAMVRMKETITDFLKKNIEDLSKGLFEKLINGDTEEIQNKIALSDAEKITIDNLIKKLEDKE